MKNIEDHINKDKEILDNSTTNPQMRRHTEMELHDLEDYKKNHPEDDHDPTPLELHCDKDPSAPECLIYDD
ncbi:MAG: hypothetical protein CBD72_05760 [Flavobacteriaceae bacterium TMED212]|nr:MAG: hypothetical protein CBC22_00155 [Alphaproteobacteria bacterium TMED62]OUW75746.1 MAG: hypothetical protein CBD72_05760 [Flavobacteriaceae bacterium TMED212]|tara:strand:- start:15466 stop:15678 length:213 start_codon:yes stop_codon:yes gene_type:complete